MTSTFGLSPRYACRTVFIFIHHDTDSCQKNDPHKCLVETSYPRERLEFKLPESFTMTTLNPDLPRPSPDYLCLRAACARIAHLSGVAEYVVSLYRDLD